MQRTYMILRKLDDSADTSDIDHTRCVASSFLRSLLKQSKERCRDEIDWEGVDGVQTSPGLERLVFE